MKAGIEIHQQLDTAKLFCECGSFIREDDPDFVFRRRLKSVVGEDGQIDVAARSEEKKRRKFVYQGYEDTNCLIELDEQPISSMNQDALNIAYQTCLLLGAKVVDDIQIMRKIVVDGSNTSGFQRTSLVGLDGSLETSEGKVGISSVCLEEDSCRKISEDSNSVTYRLDRLGIPLVEIATEPDLKSPSQVKEAAEKLGMILRSIKGVKRGLGTIRQDVNVSIPKGNRIEIKGAQDLKMIPTLVSNEVMRQEKLLEHSSKLGKVNVAGKIVDLTSLFKDSESKIIRSALDKGGVVLGVKLEGYEGLIGFSVNPGRRFGSELSDYAKIASGVGGIFHSDELPKYGINEILKIRHDLKCSKKDGFVIVAGSVDQCNLALEAVVDRANITGVPKEVRKANADGTSSFLRPMPGAARMYPETDVLPVLSDVSSVKVPKLITDIASKASKKHKLSSDLANKLIKSGKYDLFEEFAGKFSNIKPAFIAETLVGAEGAVKSQFKVSVNVSDNDFRDLFIHLDAGMISKDSVLEILRDSVSKPIQDVIVGYELMSDKDLKKELKSIVDSGKGQPFNVLIGKAMGKLRGKADGKRVSQILKELIG